MVFSFIAFVITQKTLNTFRAGKRIQSLPFMGDLWHFEWELGVLGFLFVSAALLDVPSVHDVSSPLEGSASSTGYT